MRIIYITLISLASFMFSLFLAKPNTKEINEFLSSKVTYWAALEMKRDDLTSNMTYFLPSSGQAKFVFRLTLPVFMRVLHLDRYQLHHIQFFMGFLIFLLWGLLTASFTRSYGEIAFSTLALAGAFYGKAFNIDGETAVNTASYFLLLYCLYFRSNVYLLAIGLAALFFNDERGIVSFSIIGLFILFWDSNEIKDIMSVLRNRSIQVLAGTFAACCAFRLFLQVHYDMHLPMAGVGLDIFQAQWKSYQTGIISGLGGYIVVLAYGLYHIGARRHYILFALLLSIVLFYLFATAIVMDMSKVICYLTPLAILIWKKMKESDINIRPYILSVCTINVFLPTTLVVGRNVFFYYSYIYDLVFKLFSLFHI